jgi:Na+-driven multidrug efflux pump
MIFSALLMGVAGLLMEFMPHEILRFFGEAPIGGIAPLLVQLAGALYLGFAMTNWMAKGVLIGGIYARPLAVGNFAHFLIGALALLKFAVGLPNLWLVWVFAVIYALLAILFGFVFFTHPLKTKDASGK